MEEDGSLLPVARFKGITNPSHLAVHPSRKWLYAVSETGTLLEVFPGTPEVRDGHMWPNDLPGLGIDIDEGAAADYPVELSTVEWTQSRWRDGTLWTP